MAESRRPVLVQAVLERPQAPPGVVAPMPEKADTWPGTLLAWRWTDQPAGLWTGLVRYRREGLMHEHWIAGELLHEIPQACVGDVDDTGREGKPRHGTSNDRPVHAHLGRHREIGVTAPTSGSVPALDPRGQDAAEKQDAGDGR